MPRSYLCAAVAIAVSVRRSRRLADYLAAQHAHAPLKSAEFELSISFTVQSLCSSVGSVHKCDSRISANTCDQHSSTGLGRIGLRCPAALQNALAEIARNRGSIRFKVRADLSLRLHCFHSRLHPAVPAARHRETP